MKITQFGYAGDAEKPPLPKILAAVKDSEAEAEAHAPALSHGRARELLALLDSHPHAPARRPAGARYAKRECLPRRRRQTSRNFSAQAVRPGVPYAKGVTPIPR